MLHIFFIYTTGAPRLPNLGLGKITIKFETDPSIFATCLKSLTLPRRFRDQAIFSLSLEGILNLASRSFNCVSKGSRTKSNNVFLLIRNV